MHVCVFNTQTLSFSCFPQVFPPKSLKYDPPSTAATHTCTPNLALFPLFLLSPNPPSFRVSFFPLSRWVIWINPSLSHPLVEDAATAAATTTTVQKSATFFFRVHSRVQHNELTSVLLLLLEVALDVPRLWLIALLNCIILAIWIKDRSSSLSMYFHSHSTTDWSSSCRGLVQHAVFGRHTSNGSFEWKLEEIRRRDDIYVLN